MIIKLRANHSTKVSSRFNVASAGSALVYVAFMVFTLIAFLGIAIYAGLTAYLQSEVNKAATYAALVGAAAVWDGDSGASGVPVRESPGIVTGAASSAFGAMLSQNPALQAFGAGLSGVSLQGSQLQLRARASIPTPFLSLAGVNQVNINATSNAQYAQRDLPADRFTINSASGPYYRYMTLDPAILDGPMADLLIRSQPVGPGFHGYMVEICYNGGAQCRDISSAARSLDGGSIVVDRVYPGGTRRVLYGNFSFDLSATGPRYSENVKKGTVLKILDDGVADVRSGSQRFLEVFPQPTRFSQVRVLHQAALCTNTGACTLPPGYVGG